MQVSIMGSDMLYAGDEIAMIVKYNAWPQIQ